MIGDTVNIAKRVESDIASGGEIVIGPETYAQVQGSFQCEALPAAQLRGKQRSIQLYRIEAAC